MLFGALAWLLAVLAAIPVGMFALECLLGARPERSEVEPTASPPPFAVLMPAHDEARGIVATLAAVLAQLRPGDRLIVVADNCSDDTAALARAMGADVVERDCPELRGKGLALAAGRAALLADPPPVVIVLDADCRAADGALVCLAAEAAATGAAVQGCYLLAPASGGVLGQLSTFAFTVKNLVRQRGLRRLGAPALLQGSGMAFPWPMFAAARLASANLVEDLELGLDLVRRGQHVSFLAEAGFTSAPTALKAIRTQRTRWEHGTVITGWRAVLPLAGAAIRGRPALAWLALDLIVPPLSLLVVLLALATGIAAGVALSGGPAGPLAVDLGAAATFTAAVITAWHRAGRDHLPVQSLLRIPAYVVWKLPIYWRLLADRQRAWVRTSRDD